MIGRLPVDVADVDVDALSLKVSQPLTVTGRVVLEGGAGMRPAGTGALRIELRPDRQALGTGVAMTPAGGGALLGSPVTDSSPAAAVDASGRFRLQNVAMGVYRVYISIPAEWQNAAVKSVRWGTTDALNTAITLDGRVQRDIDIVVVVPDVR